MTVTNTTAPTHAQAQENRQTRLVNAAYAMIAPLPKTATPEQRVVYQTYLGDRACILKRYSEAVWKGADASGIMRELQARNAKARFDTKPQQVIEVAPTVIDVNSCDLADAPPPPPAAFTNLLAALRRP